MLNNKPMPTIASTWDRYGLNIVPKYEFPWFYHLDPVDPLLKIFDALHSPVVRLIQTGSNIAFVFTFKLNISYFCPVDNPDQVLKISEL